jgi:hypothetical protein
MFFLFFFAELISAFEQYSDLDYSIRKMLLLNSGWIICAMVEMRE